MCEVGLPQWEVPVFYVLGIYCQKFPLHFSSSDSRLTLISISQQTRFCFRMGFNRRAENTRLRKHVVLNYQFIRIHVISWPAPSINVKFIPTLFVKNIFPKLVSQCLERAYLFKPPTPTPPTPPPPAGPPKNKHVIEVEIPSHFNGTNFKTDN